MFADERPRDVSFLEPNTNTRLWAALKNASRGLWGGHVYDPDAIIAKLGG
jgi:hypothetical protein